MGNRIKGKVKKKSIKAAISSSVGSKRKLSRMGKRQKKNHSGLDATMIGRARCLKILQLSIKDFRKLCILKGIYPREPLNGRFPKNNKNQSYYHIKDIRAIAHEPILEKFRDFSAFMKKVRKAAGRNQIDEANRRNTILPKYTLHHVVKERYPRFIDALADIDDCLTLTFLYATLPADTSNNHLPSPKFIAKAKLLASAWGAYCAVTASITKQFVSIKGVYMEALVQSTPIRWIIPHAFTQYIPDDVDFRIMNTFFELYQVLLDFVLFKLYNDIGVRYPLNTLNTLSPETLLGGGVRGTTSVILGSHLKALMSALDSASAGGTISTVVALSLQERTQQTAKVKDMSVMDDSTLGTKSNRKSKNDNRLQSVDEVLKRVKNVDNHHGDDDELDGSNEEDEEVDENVDISSPLKVALEKLTDDQARASLPCSSHNNSTNGMTNSKDEVDEDAIQRKRLFAGFTFFLSREVPRGYIELVCLAYGAKNIGWEHGIDSPIKINDPSITHQIVDRPKLPTTGLPKSREYIQPQWVFDCANFMFLLPVTRYLVGTTLPPHLSPWVDDEEEGYKPAYAEEIERLKNGIEDPVMDDDNATCESSEEEHENDQTTSNMLDVEPQVDTNTSAPLKDSIDAGDKEKLEEMDDRNNDDDDDDDDDEEEETEEELQKREARKRKKEEDETQRLAKSMMSRKASFLYGRMQHGIALKKSKVEELHQRRKMLDATSHHNGFDSDGNDDDDKIKMKPSSKAANRDII